jgi:lysozyme
MFESLHDGDLSTIGLQPKMDPIGIWTEGYGHAMRFNSALIRGAQNRELAHRLSSVKNEAEANKLLMADLAKFEAEVTRLVASQVNQNQFDALVSFTFNLGSSNLATSTLLKKVNANPADPGIRAEFDKWVFSDHVKLPGLVRRRKAEANLYFS